MQCTLKMCCCGVAIHIDVCFGNAAMVYLRSMLPWECEHTEHWCWWVSMGSMSFGVDMASIVACIHDHTFMMVIAIHYMFISFANKAWLCSQRWQRSVVCKKGSSCQASSHRKLYDVLMQEACVFSRYRLVVDQCWAWCSGRHTPIMTYGPVSCGYRLGHACLIKMLVLQHGESHSARVVLYRNVQCRVMAL